MIVTAYFDESGTHGADRTVVAGVLASAEQIAALEARWELILRCHNLTHLHAVDMFNRKKQFNERHPNDITNLGIAAAELTANHSLFCASGILYNTDYDMHYRTKDVPKRVRLDSKYGLCFRNTLSYACQMLWNVDRVNPPDLHVIIESGQKNSGEATNIFRELQNSGFEPFCSMLKSFTIANKTDFVGLQAADLLAWSTARMESRQMPEMADVSAEQATNPTARKGTIFRVPMTAGIIAEQREDLIELLRMKQEFGKRRAKAIVSQTPVQGPEEVSD